MVPCRCGVAATCDCDTILIVHSLFRSSKDATFTHHDFTMIILLVRFIAEDVWSSFQALLYCIVLYCIVLFCFDTVACLAYSMSHDCFSLIPFRYRLVRVDLNSLGQSGDAHIPGTTWVFPDEDKPQEKKVVHDVSILIHALLTQLSEQCVGSGRTRRRFRYGGRSIVVTILYH